MTEQEAQELRAENERLMQEVARLKEAITLQEARTYVAEVLAGIEMPTMTRARLTEMLVKTPSVQEDGSLDREGYRTRIEEAARAEIAYLAEVSGSGKITGMGAPPPASSDVKAQLKEAFKRAGLSDEAAEIAAKGR